MPALSHAQYIHYLDLFSKPACRELVTFCIFMDLNFIPVNNNIWKKPSSIQPFWPHDACQQHIHNLFCTEEPLAGLNKHELSGKKEMYDAETQTEDLQENGENPLFHSLLQGLEEIVHTRLTQPRWDESPAPGLPVFEPESPDHSSSESGLNELG